MGPMVPARQARRLNTACAIECEGLVIASVKGWFMRWRKRISPEMAALIEVIRANRPKDRGWLREITQSLIQGVLIALVGGGIGIYGADHGAKTAGDVQIKLDQQRNVHADQQQHERDVRADAQLRIDKAERIIMLIEKTAPTNAAVTQAILLSPTHTAIVPDDPEQVTALVTLYFPSALDDARAYEARCAEHFAAVQQMVIDRLAGKKPSNVDDDIFQRALSAGDLVAYDVMTALGKPYKKRISVTGAQVRRWKVR